MDHQLHRYPTWSMARSMANIKRTVLIQAEMQVSNGTLQTDQRTFQVRKLDLEKIWEHWDSWIESFLLDDFFLFLYPPSPASLVLTNFAERYIFTRTIFTFRWTCAGFASDNILLSRSVLHLLCYDSLLLRYKFYVAFDGLGALRYSGGFNEHLNWARCTLRYGMKSGLKSAGILSVIFIYFYALCAFYLCIAVIVVAAHL